MNIILIGMPGSGKSTLGVVLAKILGSEFLDSDIVIQHQQNRLLHEILETDGIDKFLEIEGNVNASIIPKESSVIATGGSVVYSKKAMEHFKKIGKVVYLKIDYNSLVERLGDLAERGVVLKDGMTLEGLYKERCPLYEKYADITVEVEGASVLEAVERINDELRNISK